MNADDLYAQIEKRYQFAIPKAYREMRARGWFDYPKNCYAPSLSEDFLWIYDWELYSLEAILDYEFEEEPAANFVPFARSVSRDVFAWYPEKTKQGSTPVVDLLDGDETGTVLAPDFVGGIYHQILSYCSGFSGLKGESFDPVEKEARQSLGKWRKQLADYFPPAWLDQLKALQEAPIIKTAPDYGMLFDHGKWKDILQRDLGHPQKKADREFTWIEQ